jgi:hypothetical protein
MKKMASIIGFGNTEEKNRCCKRAPLPPQIALHHYWKTSFSPLLPLKDLTFYT